MSAHPIHYPVYQPHFYGNEKKYVNQCLDDLWISSHGEFVDRFEQAFARYLGINHALSCTNGTVALHLALLALELGHGDEVIVPSLTYVATANAVSYVGALPVFIDSEPTYFQMDPEKIEAKITAKTKAIIVVHLYGHAADMTPIVALAKKYGLYLIEDCAEAIGTRYHEQWVGTFGDIATFSFFGNKTLTTGEGGMVVTASHLLAERVAKFKGQGVSKTSNYFHEIRGYNYRMTNICCAIGLAQLENIHLVIEKKIKIATLYQSYLADSDVLFHEQQPNTHHTHWLVSILLKDHLQREGLRQHLLEQGIDSRPFFIPMHQLPMYQQSIHLPVAEDLSARGLCLPSYPTLTERDIAFITFHIQQYLTDFSAATAHPPFEHFLRMTKEKGEHLS